jgi:hypothetical protein
MRAFQPWPLPRYSGDPQGKSNWAAIQDEKNRIRKEKKKRTRKLQKQRGVR